MSDNNNGHARWSPSRAHRDLHCAGAAAMEHGLPDTSSEYADEGTAAHELAAMCLNEGKDASAYLGRVIQVNHGTLKYRTFTVDDEMAAQVQKYVDSVRLYASTGEFSGPGPYEHTLLVEQAVPIDHITGEKGAEGTSDAIIITADGSELQVHDLKYGQGVRVDAEENEQLMLYALGALKVVELLGYEPERVRLVIHQPRLDHLSEWDCPIKWLLGFSMGAREKYSRCRDAFDRSFEWIGAGDWDRLNYLNPSEDACRFCKAKATCPALARFVQETVGEDFEVIAEHGAPTITEPSNTAFLSKCMAATPLIEDWCRAVRAKVEAELFAGNAVPGFKLVQGKRGARAWSDESEVEKTLKSFRLKQEEMYSFKLITPTAAEKLLKTKPKRWKKLTGLITQSEGSPSVAPESDKRPALVIGKVEDDFEALTE